MNVNTLTQRVIAVIDRTVREDAPLLVAIDGRCASGKTTLAAALEAHYGCSVIHMDHFFLRPEQRTEERLNTPGENVDHERFLAEALLPLVRGEAFSYRPYDCGCQALSAPIHIPARRLTIIEGSYACHPALWAHYGLRLFLTVDPEEQMRRLIFRNGDYAQVFRDKWIPLEERYFSAYDLEHRCDHCFKT